MKDIRAWKWSSYNEYFENVSFIDANFVLHISHKSNYNGQSHKSLKIGYFGTAHCKDIIAIYIGMFSKNRSRALEKVKRYLSEANEDNCLEYEEKRKVSDEEVKILFMKLGIKNISELQQSEKQKRDDAIKKVKGITIRQLARIIGISKSVIGRL